MPDIAIEDSHQPTYAELRIIGMTAEARYRRNEQDMALPPALIWQLVRLAVTNPDIRAAGS